MTFGAEHATGVDEYHGFKLADLAVGGFAIEIGRDQRPARVRLGDAVAPLKLNLIDEVTRLLPDGAPCRSGSVPVPPTVGRGCESAASP
jgi:hypothetical protein